MFGFSVSIYIYRESTRWFLILGMHTSNLTSATDLFLQNSRTEYWSFEAVYSFVSGIASSAINFRINQPPRNGSCSINPLNGTTSTLFTISCWNWFDEHGIQDYSLYGMYFPNLLKSNCHLKYTSISTDYLHKTIWHLMNSFSIKYLL